MKANEIDLKNPEFWDKYSSQLQKGPVNTKCLKPETWDRVAETYDDLDACPDYMEQVDSVVDMLKSRALTQESTVLDVACGTGTYAIRMAPYCRRVTALDISGGMLNQLKKKAEAAGLTNIEIVQKDWFHYQPKERFDLVFVSMTPLTRSTDNLKRMLHLSRRFFGLVTWAGIRENLLLKEMYEQIMGRPLKQKGMDIVLPFNYIYSLGYAPEIRFFRGCWERRRRVDQQADNLIWRLELYRELTRQEKELVRQKVSELADENGMVTVKTRVRTCFMLVDKEAEGFSCT